MTVCVCFLCTLSRIDETVMLNADILPKLNYVSMTWNDHSMSGDSRSPADMTSVVSAVNAAAIKYLSDQQLAQQVIAVANKGRNTSLRSAKCSGQAAASSSNASIYGVKSANLSLASKKYFEKHRLGTNRAHPSVTEPQSAMSGQMSKSRMEDLLKSITSQVNNLQVTMSLKHSPQRNVTTDDVDSSRHVKNNVSVNRRRSDRSNVSSVGSENLPVRQHDRNSFDSSALSNAGLYETWRSEWQNPSRHRSSLDSSKHRPRHHGVQLHTIDQTLDFDHDVMLDRNSPL